MRPRRGERVLGPYADRGNHRVIVVDEQGDRTVSVFKTEAQAERFKEIQIAELASEDHTTETALALYKVHLVDKGNKPDSIRQTLWAIDQFFHRSVPISLLSQKRCAKLYSELKERPLKRTQEPPSVDSHRSMLAQAKSFLVWCVEQGWLRENPCEEIEGTGKRRPRGKSLGKNGTELRVKDARAWYGMAVFRAERGDQGAIAALTAMLLGMRASEITTRKVADLDDDTDQGDLLWIPCSKTAAGRRTLEVPAVLRPYLVACCAGKDRAQHIFETEGGKAHWRDWIRKNVRRICKLAGVPTVTAHAMRGVLATLTSERGMAGHLVAATLGHEDVRTTMTDYARPGSAQAGANRRGLTLLHGGVEPRKSSK